MKNKKKLRIYLFGENNGVGEYRVYKPARFIKELGLAEVRTNDFRWGQEDDKIKNPTMEELTDIGHWADIIVFQRQDLAQTIATFCGMGELFNVPVVLDTDDNIESVRPYNPGYRGYHPKSEALTWGKLVPKKVYAITVTTQNLKELHAKDCENVFILPNSLDIKRRTSFPRKAHPGKIHMGWLGSAAHYENLKIIEKPVIEILKKHKNVIFHCMSMYGNSLWGDVPPEIKKRIKKIPWSPLKEWPKTLRGLSLDIGLAPGADNLFNRAKSNLRYLEYTAAGATTIASPVLAYSCIEHGKTGFHATESWEWVEMMDKLIGDEKLRQKLQANAFKDLSKNYDIRKNAKKWVETYQQIVDKYRKERGSKQFYYPS